MHDVSIYSSKQLPVTLFQLDENQTTWPTPHVSMEQVHGTLSCEVTATTARAEGCDAMYTREKNVSLIVRAADCVPILFYSKAGIVGVIHAGRRGTQAGITRLTLEKLPKDQLQIWIGPHICATCYEVDEHTGATFDLLTENLHQIHEIFPAAHLQIDERCTKEDHSLHSYRREGKGCQMNYWEIKLLV